MAPMTVKQRDRQTGEETGETITLFKSVPVFSQDQVDPLPEREPLPLEPPREPLTGDSHAHLLPRLQAFCESLGYSASFEAIDGPAGGWCDRRASGSSSTPRRLRTASCARSCTRPRTRSASTTCATRVAALSGASERL
jgi:hypothetical protein